MMSVATHYGDEYLEAWLAEAELQEELSLDNRHIGVQYAVTRSCHNRMQGGERATWRLWRRRGSCWCSFA